jgi:dienelactone hydrolase
MPLPDFHSLAEWEKRKAFLREQILLSAGLLPMPAKTPLHPQIFGRIQGSGYTIEKVLIETMPGFYLGGNLYRPTGQGSRHPGVLNPHGHWPYGRLENQPLYSGPALGISLARQGYVVFAYDMVGYTDTLQVPHNFTSPKYSLWDFGPLGLQLWNSIRSLDFLASLPDVDPANLGVTGASGGGTQTFLLTAVDDRVQFASPVNMVSAIMQGGDACEFAPGLRIGTSNVEIAAMFAPKPMLLVSATGDWTRNVPHEEYPAIRRIYDLYGKGSNVDVVQIQARHNFNQQSREAVYRFFAKVNPGLSNPAELAEHDIGIPVLQDMMALSNKTLPSNALDLDGLFKEWKTRDLESVNQILDPSVKREFLRQTLKVEVPREVAMKQDGSRIILSRPEFKDRVAGYWFAGHGTPAVVVDPFGAEAALKSTEFATLKKEHRPIFVLDAFQTGNAKSPRDESDPAFLAYNVSDDQARVQDVITAMSHMKGNHAAMDVYATGDASLWSIFASAVVPWKVTLHLSNIPKLESDEDYLLHFGIPGIERAGGLSLALQLVQVKS